MATAEISTATKATDSATKATSRKSHQPISPSAHQFINNSSVDYLKAWMMSTKHISNPYPNKQEKTEIMALS
eukprot:scaffold13575_cov166-Alexandrium_tamarense.AAC.1